MGADSDTHGLRIETVCQSLALDVFALRDGVGDAWYEMMVG